jgi:hypoxanthine phosphoribosyltransferase
MTGPSSIGVMFTAEQIQQRVVRIAADIRRDCPRGVHLVAVLNGAFVFLADLVRQMDGPVSMDFVALASYGDGTTSSGEIRLLKDTRASSIERRDVVIVEDIVDSGRTLSKLQTMLRAQLPNTLRTACLLNKPSRRKINVPIDYVGFTIEDRFVVGYGLDHADRYRNLPYIAVLK